MECISRSRTTYPKISVIIPVYKVRSFISPCARSLFEQTLDNIEYIFVDDNSPDDSIEVLRGIVKEYPNRESSVVIISNHKNLGPSVSRNVGLEISTGEYVVFCDSDDEVEKNAYELMLIEAIEKNADIVSCGVVIDDEDISWTKCFDDNQYLSHDSLYQFDCVEGVLWSSVWNKIFRKSFLSKYDIRFHDTLKMWDDLYFTFTARFFCKVDAIVNLPLYHYKLKKTGSLTSENVLIKATSQIECTQHLESFLKLQEANDMDTILAFLKLRSKDILFNSEHIEVWRKTYPEINYMICRFVSFYGWLRIVRFYIVVYFGTLGWKLLDFYSRVKKMIKSW